MSENPLLKALIRAHTRKTKDGTIVQVREHHDKRTATQQASESAKRREALHEQALKQIAEGRAGRWKAARGGQWRIEPDDERGGIPLDIKTSDLQTGRSVIRFRTESGRVRYMGPNTVLVSDIKDAHFYKVYGQAVNVAWNFTRKYPNVGDYEILTVYLQYDAQALKKSRPVKGHTRKTPSGKLALIPPHMDKRDPARPEQLTQSAPPAASQPPTYNKRVADNLKHMGAPDGWRSLAIVGMDEGKDLKKKRAMVPQFEPIPEGYTTAPSLYLPSGGIGEQVSIGFGVGETCELCGKQGIKFRYPVVHDGKKWVMWVGSECVTTFGEASGKQQERDHQKDARKSIVLELRDMARQIVQAFSDGDRFGRDRNTHPNPSACYDVWTKLYALGRSVTLFGIDTDKEGMAETDRQLQAWLRKNEGYIAALKAAFADLMAMREFRVPLSPDEQKIADKAAATYNEAIAIVNAPDTGHGTRFRETIAVILRMLGGMSAEDYGYRIVTGQREKTVQSTHQTLTTQVKQWNAYNGVPVKKGLASLFKSRTVRAHQMRTASGQLTMRRQHTDKRDAAKPQFKEKRRTRKGNVQYVYDAETTEQAKIAKFRRVVLLAKQLPSLIEDLQAALSKGDTPRDKVVAAIVALIDRCHFRIGTDKYAERHGTFGVTTLRPEHVTVSGSEVRFQFTGKKQVPWDKTVTDPDLAEFIEHLAADSHSDRLFWYYRNGKQYPIKASHVNAFLREHGVTAKDLRTYHATKAMFEILKAASRPANAPPLTKKETAARLKAAFDKVAYEMGHTPAVCKTSYVLPQLVDDFVQNGGRLSLSAWEDAVR